ncbi:MAG TPA: ABC transporter permease subunit [Ktedonobacteraceae bacterium]|nr:ABC transporter permease subunit [Ktedonobacteraceae bacterium]
MFRSVLSKSLRDFRVPMLGWGYGMALLMVAGFATATPAVLAGFVSLAPLLGFLGQPYAMQTPEGYITFRYLETVLPLLLSFWPILAGSRLVRGEEERGTMDVLLATPQPRARLLLEKISALCIALIVIAVLFALGAVAGEARLAGGHIDFVRALLTGLNLSLLAFFFSMVALLLSQLTASRSAAAGWASGVLLLAALLDITGRVASGSWVQYLSPFYYYNLNRPLIPGFQNQPLAVLPLLGLSALCAALSFVLFARRDVGRPAFAWRERAKDTQQATRSLSRAERAVSTRTISLHTLFAERWSSFWWLLGIVAFCAYILILTPKVQGPFYKIVQQTPWLQKLFFDTPTSTNAGVLGTILFSFMPALVVILALTLALKWSADLENGRLELIFSTPQSRLRVQLERLGANILLALLAPVLTWLALISGAQLINLNIDQGRVLAASFSMFPLALITISAVFALAGRLRYGAVLGILTAYLALSFLEETLEGAIQMPSWLMSLSIFHLYGNPIFQGMNWGNFLGMVGVAIVLLVIGLVQFRYADVELG